MALVKLSNNSTRPLDGRLASFQFGQHDLFRADAVNNIAGNGNHAGLVALHSRIANIERRHDPLILRHGYNGYKADQFVCTVNPICRCGLPVVPLKLIMQRVLKTARRSHEPLRSYPAMLVAKRLNSTTYFVLT